MNSTTAKLTLAQVREEFKKFNPANGRSKELGLGVKEHLSVLAESMREARSSDSYGRPGKNMTLDEGVQHVFGASVNDLCYALNFSPSSDSLSDFITKLGHNGANFGAKEMGQIMVASANFTTNGVGGIAPQYAFLISELLMRPIVIKHDIVAQHRNWVSQSFTVQKSRGEIPTYNFRNIKAEQVTEGSVGANSKITLGQKPYLVKEFSASFEFSNQMIRETPFNILAGSVQEAAGPALARIHDGLALATLIYGDIWAAPDYVEQAPVVGVDTLNTLAAKDVSRVRKVMNDMGMKISHVGLQVEEAIANLYAGSSGNPFTTVGQMYPAWTEVSGPLPEGKQLFFDASVSMAELTWGAMTVKQAENIDTNNTRVVIRSNKGFVIMNALGRVIIDKTKLLADHPYPESMTAAAVYGDPYLNWLK